MAHARQSHASILNPHTCTLIYCRTDLCVISARGRPPCCCTDMHTLHMCLYPALLLYLPPCLLCMHLHLPCSSLLDAAINGTLLDTFLATKNLTVKALTERNSTLLLTSDLFQERFDCPSTYHS